jgi:DNA-binding transcriptional ArsR family regulator
MRPLFHPAIDEVTVEAVLHALSDPTRVAIFSEIAGAGANCTQTCSDFVHISDRAIPKSTLSLHFKVLRESGLIRSERIGVEMRNISRCTELQHRFPGLIASIIKAHKIQQADEARVQKSAKSRRKK